MLIQFSVFTSIPFSFITQKNRRRYNNVFYTLYYSRYIMMILYTPLNEVCCMLLIYICFSYSYSGKQIFSSLKKYGNKISTNMVMYRSLKLRQLLFKIFLETLSQGEKRRIGGEFVFLFTYLHLSMYTTRLPPSKRVVRVMNFTTPGKSSSCCHSSNTKSKVRWPTHSPTHSKEKKIEK